MDSESYETIQGGSSDLRKTPSDNDAAEEVAKEKKDADLEKSIERLASIVERLREDMTSTKDRMCESETRIIDCVARVESVESAEGITQALDFSMDCISEATVKALEKITTQTSNEAVLEEIDTGDEVQFELGRSDLELGEFGTPEFERIRIGKSNILENIPEGLSTDFLLSDSFNFVVENLNNETKRSSDQQQNISQLGEPIQLDTEKRETKIGRRSVLELITRQFKKSSKKRESDHSDYRFKDSFLNLPAPDQHQVLATRGHIPTFPADTYSFITLHGPIESPKYFFFGFAVFLFQISFLVFLLLSKVNEDHDNPSQNWFVPPNVTNLVRGTQILAIFSYLLFADSSISDCARATETWPRFSVDKGGIVRQRVMFSCILRFIQGFLASIVALLLIVCADNVIEIVLNFTAVNFISGLDECAFELVKFGKWGPVMGAEARRIENCPIPYCLYKKRLHFHYQCTLALIGTAMLVFTSIVIYKQSFSNSWTTQIVRVQFTDSTGLQTYSGCYKRDEDVPLRSKYEQYNSFNTNKDKATFRYCTSGHQWRLFANQSDFIEDPCQTENMIAYSRKTTEIDIISAIDNMWFSAGGIPLVDMYFFKTETNGEELEKDCGSFVGDGRCDEQFNKQEFNFDGGDCCASTCLYYDCGRGGAVDAFGIPGIKSSGSRSNASNGVGFPNCRNPNMANMTIFLNKISSSRDRKTMNVTTLQLIEYGRERDFGFWEETPAPAYFVVDCDNTTILSMFIDDRMEHGTEIISVEEGAHCVVTARNVNNLVDRWDNEPIWWVNYTIFDTSDEISTHEIVSGYSGQQGSISFQHLPKCYFDLLTDDTNISTVYTENTDYTKAIFWLASTKQRHSICGSGRGSKERLLERFALGTLNFAAPIERVNNVSGIPSTSFSEDSTTEIEYDEDMLWISAKEQCRWDTVSCENGHVTHLFVRGEGLKGTISTHVGLLTNLKRFEYDANGLFGKIPSEIGLLTKLTGLDLDLNDLFGTIPTEIGSLVRLVEVDLDSNKLTGTIPTEIGQMEAVHEFDFKHNTLSGPIPSEVGVLMNLRMVEFESNMLSGTIPSEMTLIDSLNILTLSNNTMTGMVPSEIGRLQDLVRLDLQNNNFSGSIPTEIGRLTKLEILNLRGNSFNGKIPTEIGFLTNLREIWFDGNNFSGTIPMQVSFLKRLHTLASDSSLDGLIPHNLKTLDKCVLCNGQKHEQLHTNVTVVYDREAGGFITYSCAELLEATLISSNGCDALEENCVICGSDSP